jgi:cytochrome c-type biogenesis protein
VTFTGGTLGLAALSLAAGTVSIALPCCLPLIPGYLAYVSGVGAGEMGHTKRVLGAASLFVLGFAIVFTALGATASVLGTFLVGRLSLLVKVVGVFVIAMGLATLGVLRVPCLYRERRIDLHRVRSAPAGAVPLGMAFAFGWTPCIGPVLGAILTTAATTRTASKGAFLLFMYSLGLGIPFLLLALVYARAGRSFRNPATPRAGDRAGWRGVARGGRCAAGNRGLAEPLHALGQTLREEPLARLTEPPGPAARSRGAGWRAAGPDGWSAVSSPSW